ncbi:MAG TPA: hypothetical protein VEY50_03605 [Lysobacter sp.]|nr:hypothetical protein [Lysobacter sp.]
MSTIRGEANRAPHRLRHAAAAAVLALLASCSSGEPAEDAPPRQPEDAVRQLVGDLRRGDPAAYARHAVPAELHARLETAWREGRTLWPLTELPLHGQLPGFLATMAQPDADKALLTQYRRQFAGAHAELRSAATTLGLFATRYVAASPDYSPDERAHYVRLIGALSAWGQRAPLGDPARAREAIPQLVAGARLTGLRDPARFRRDGMAATLARLRPFAVRFKQVLAAHYGLDLDAALDSVQTQLLEQDGDHARVRVRYRLAGQAIEGTVRVERRDGRWYLSDLLRHAEAEASRPHPGSVATGTAVAR